MRAVFDGLPFGTFWYVKGFKEERLWKRVRSWEKLERFMNTNEPRPALTSILIDQIIAWYDAICQMFYDLNIPKRIRCDIFGGKVLRMDDVFLT